MSTKEKCARCEGSGFEGDAQLPCSFCGGDGWLFMNNSDNPEEQRDLVTEARELLANAAHGPLTLIRYEHGGGRLYREEPRELIADFYDAANCEFYSRARDLVSSLCSELEQLHADSAEIAERLIRCADRCGELITDNEELRSLNSTQAESIRTFQEQAKLMREAIKAALHYLESDGAESNADEIEEQLRAAISPKE